MKSANIEYGDLEILVTYDHDGVDSAVITDEYLALEPDEPLPLDGFTDAAVAAISESPTQNLYPLMTYEQEELLAEAIAKAHKPRKAWAPEYADRIRAALVGSAEARCAA